MGTMEGIPLTTSLAAVRSYLLAACNYQSNELDPGFFRPSVPQVASNYPNIPRRLGQYDPTLDLRRAANASARMRARKCRTSLVRCSHDR